MYNVTVCREFIAQHYLINGNFGSENNLNSHLFKIELSVSASKLNKHNYVIDIDYIKSFLDHLEIKYKDKCLNDFEEFEKQNPSLEWFCYVIYNEFLNHITPLTVDQLKVTIWEDNCCYASYSK